MPHIKPSEINNNQYDFIIIGETGHKTQEELLEARIPLFNSKLKNTDVDWQMKSTKQPEANDRVIGVPSGKLLGGSSAFNACLLHRCSPSDYDAWNVPEWSYEHLKYYFRKAENFHDDDQPVSKEIHGTSGPLDVFQTAIKSPLGVHFKAACEKECGLAAFDDMTDLPCQIGVTGMQATIYKGERISTGTSYLPNEIRNNRSNLFIGLGCAVSRLILDDNKKVSQIEFRYINEDNTYRVSVSREVILCAGAILTPSILLASGIGSTSELETLGIQTVVDLPGVGKNLQNHWRVPLVHETTRSEMSLHHDIFKKEKESLERAIHQKDGALTRLWPDAVAFMKVPDTPDNSSSLINTPQIELFTGGLALCRQLPQLKHLDCATLLMVYVAPFSTGSVSLNLDHTPKIDLGLLSDKRDLEVLEKGLALSMAIANNSNYKENCVKRWLLYPDDINNRESVQSYIKEHVDTLHHYAGTCKMGPKSDRFSVVDSHLKVYGVKGLRVADASFFPIVPAGQICFPVIACAERASDIILQDNE
ncbi:MAG: GMC oxidoreductase-domain-containing protein [Benjaminiella poitrasii]|nr:MAG: GMC oxidoreductase-domain-containing protein [Benjaminiella poitrasii]